jgi:hypothetical protein
VTSSRPLLRCGDCASWIGNTPYRHTGFQWELIEHLTAPNGAKVHSLRLSQRIRAIAFRDGDFLRLISLHPDHDSAYER